MKHYLFWRLLQLIPVLFGITLVVFLSMALVPGDTAQALLGPYASAENVAALRATLGLDENPVQRYFIWLGNLLQGDFGYAYSISSPVIDELLARLGPTVLLASVALLIAVVVGIAAGTLMAVYQYAWPDRLLSVVILLGISLPSFWLALMAILIFAVAFPMFPVGGMYRIIGGGGLADLVYHLILPALVLAFVPTAVLGRLTRTYMLETLRTDYVRTARAKGLTERRVILHHALRNAVVALVPVIGTQVGYVLGGAVYVESIFQWPGIGRLLVQAVASRDILLLQGGVLLIATVYVLINLAADLLQRALDPRLKA